VEREREIEAFKNVEYWSLEAELSAARSPATPRDDSFFAQLVEWNGKRLAVWDKKEQKKDVFYIKTKAEADLHLKALENATYNIAKIDKKEVKRYAPALLPPQLCNKTAGNRLGFTAKKTMMFAQNLYEQGLITYMRTDSFNLSAPAVLSARSLIEQQFGKQYLPNSPRMYKSKSKTPRKLMRQLGPLRSTVRYQIWPVKVG